MSFKFPLFILWAIAVLPPLQLSGQVDRQATAETKALFENLQQIGSTDFIFGAQTTTSMGRGWVTDSDNPLRSDVQKSTGDFPGVFGFDFYKWELNLDKGAMTDLKQVKEIYCRGGIVTFSWHTPNPVTGENCRDLTGEPLTAILPGGARNALFNTWLDEIAAFAKAAHVDGKAIPIIFRPFHENTGQWFWWGSQNTPETYIAAFRYVVTYLRDQKNVHSFLYAFSPSKPTSTSHYLETYPGDDYVDIFGFDCYLPTSGKEKLKPYLEIVAQLAREKQKIAAVTEVGCRNGLQNSSDAQWFSHNILNPIKALPPEANIAFCLTWHNHETEYWVPLPGDVAHEDFLEFYRDPATLFLSDLPALYRPAAFSN